MALYLHVCQDYKKNEFLLISEQTFDCALPEIKAQIYFEHHASDLKINEPVDIVSYGISKKETEELLNLSQKKPTSDKNLGLFAQGRVEKKQSFKIYSYSSLVAMNELLTALHIKKPSHTSYLARSVKPDMEHILEDKHKIFWRNFSPLEPRNNIDFSKWTDFEARETELLNQLNTINLILADQEY